MRCVSVGPESSRIVLVGEAPGAEEEAEGKPFVGSSGYQLATMLRDAKLLQPTANADGKGNLIRDLHSQFYITNVVMDRPPGNDLSLWINPKKELRDGTEVEFRGKKVKPHVKADCERLYRELSAVRPNVVVACGNTALWALTGQTSVAKWRGSTLESDAVRGLKVIPVYHPAAILRQYEWRHITVQDFRRVKREANTPDIRRPRWNFQIGPSFAETVTRLRELTTLADQMKELWLTCDVEIKRREILCVGIAWSKHDALCIPFYGPHIRNDGSRFYYDPSQTVIVVELLRNLLQHRNVRLCNQNVGFDIQYLFWRFGIWPKAHFDTMLAQNVLFAGTPKALDYLASMYCEYYVYWKDDGKFWPDNASVDFPKLWTYNCTDCVVTYEVMEAQKQALRAYGLEEQMAFVMRLFPHAMKMMLRGVKVDREAKKELTTEVTDLLVGLLQETEYIAGMSLTGDKGGFSSPKLLNFFYERLRLPVQKNKVFRGGAMTMAPTCDDQALKKLARLEPCVKPLTMRINMIRAFDTVSDVLTKRVDGDGRWRTEYNLGGTNTYRWSSSENPFGSGLNLQNLTIGKDVTL